MKVTITQNDIKMMKNEAMWLYNGKIYIIIIVIIVFIIVDIIISLKNNKFRWQCIILLISLIVCIKLIINNNLLLNKFFEVYSRYESLDCIYEIQNDSLLIKSITRDYYSKINKNDITKILYKKHTIFIYTIDNKVTIIPNRINIDEFLK